jgi:hypothetical protein
MRVVWEPDPDNVYLSSGTDNLALHRAPAGTTSGALDHLGSSSICRRRWTGSLPSSATSACAWRRSRATIATAAARSTAWIRTACQVLYEPTLSKQKIG